MRVYETVDRPFSYDHFEIKINGVQNFKIVQDPINCRRVTKEQIENLHKLFSEVNDEELKVGEGEDIFKRKNATATKS